LTGQFLALRDAILRQAAEDYQHARRAVNRLSKQSNLTKDENETLMHAQCGVEEVELFFKSKWAGVLCVGVDPLEILRMLKTRAPLGRRGANRR